MTLLLLAAVPAAGQVALDDADGDGVTDVLDTCPDTPEGDLIAPDGCSVCACDAAWGSHAEYVRCVASEARQRRGSGTLRSRELRAALARARRSTCGNPQLTRCCIYLDGDADAGTCRLMRPDACAALDDSDRVGTADDEGSGSCLPNPCTF